VYWRMDLERKRLLKEDRRGSLRGIMSDTRHVPLAFSAFPAILTS
jgi:hypothetical protein